MVVIGLGEAGNNICRLVAQISNLRVVSLDEGSGIPKCSSHEKYEDSVPLLSKKLRLGKEKDIWFVLCGAGKISGAALAVLEQVKDRRVRVAYVYPDEILLSRTQKMQNKVVFNVLQQYARSGLFDSLYLFSNKEIESFVGKGTISSMYDKINHTVANYIVTANWFENTDSLVGEVHEPKDISRIRTVSLGKIDEEKENLFFPLENATEASYYYSISSEDKESEENLLTLVKERVILDKEREIESSFSIWENNSDVSFFYSIKYTHFIQEEMQ
jgi:hypothetical protein